MLKYKNKKITTGVQTGRKIKTDAEKINIEKERKIAIMK